MHKDINVNVSGPVQPTSTYKTKVLKGNHSFASQVTEPNTKYVIKHDFDLGGESVTIPANCILEFDGGSLSGAYTLTGDGTDIDASLVKIFDTNITLSGTWNVAEAYPEWFGAKGDGESDDSLAVQAAVNFSSGFRTPVVHFSSKIYIVDGILLSSRVCIEGEGITTQLISGSVDKSMFYNIASTPIHVSKFKDFSLNFNSAKTVPTIDILNSYGCEFENLWVNGSSTSGNNVPTIKLHREGSATTYITRIRNSRFIYATIYIESTDSIITDNIINGTGKEYALILYNSGNTNIENNQMVAGSVSAIHVTGTYNQEGLKIVGNYFDGAPTEIRVGGAIKMSQTLINSVISSNNFWKIHAEAIFGTNIRLSTIIGNSFQDCGYFDDTLADIHLSTLSFGLAITGNIFVKEVYYNGTAIVNRVNSAKILQLDVLPSTATTPSIFSGNVAYGKYQDNSLGEYYYLGYNIGTSVYNANPGTGKTPSYNFAWNSIKERATFKVGNNWVDAYNYNSQLRRIGWREDRNQPTPSANDIGFQYFNRSRNQPNYWTGTKWVDATGIDPDVQHDGPLSSMPTETGKIKEGYMFMINRNDEHFPVFAHINGNTIEWYKADGTQYTGN